MSVSIPDLKRVNLSLVLPWLAFAALISILPVAFLYEKGGRVLFYYCGYFSLLGLAVELLRKNKVWLNDKRALSLLILGGMFIFWSAIVQISPHVQNEDYYTAGKRCILSFIIITYTLHLFRTGVIEKSLAIKLSILSLTLAFISSSAFGLYQGITSTERVVLGINRATLTAYAYSAMSLALIAVILKLQTSKKQKACFLLVSIVSLYIIMLTQTRSAMVIHTLLLLYMSFRLFALTRNIKFIACIVVLMLTASALSYKLIEGRLDTTIQEYNAYQSGNDRTSLGSRFTMWKTGILAFEASPLGQTQYHRNQFIKEYLYAHNQPKSWALYYMNVHLHNEFIQFASLFGIAGIIALIYFFYVFIFLEYKCHRTLTPLAIAGLAILLYGLTDVVMTSVEFIVMFSVLIVILTILQAGKES